MNNKYEVYDEKYYGIKDTNIIGTLIDVQYREDRKEYLYILEEDNHELHDVWESDIKELTKENKNYIIINDSWNNLDNKISNESISQLKSMTDSQLRKQGEIENIPNYTRMTREELLNALIEIEQAEDK